MTRRTLVGSLAAAAVIKGQNPPAHHHPHAAHNEWKPLLGVLGHYTPANVEFAKAQGFNNMILSSGPHSSLDATTITDSQLQEVKSTLDKFGMHVSAFQI